MPSPKLYAYLRKINCLHYLLMSGNSFILFLYFYSWCSVCSSKVLAGGEQATKGATHLQNLYGRGSVCCVCAMRAPCVLCNLRTTTEQVSYLPINYSWYCPHLHVVMQDIQTILKFTFTTASDRTDVFGLFLNFLQTI